MRRRLPTTIAALVLFSLLLPGARAVAGTPPARPSSAPAAGGTWGNAEEIPGSGHLNHGGMDAIVSLSCAAPGYCSAGGDYTSSYVNNFPVLQAMVATETGGVWTTVEEVPGTATLNSGGRAEVDSLSCPAEGDCSAAGFYSDGADHEQAFVANESDGTWGTAEEVPGTATLNAGDPGAETVSVACAAAGDCSAGGFYADAAGDQQAFVVSETKGTWGTAEEIPGSGALNKGGSAGINSVSCTAVGDCSAGGYYASSTTDGIPTLQALIVNQTNGTWSQAKEVPGTGALNAGGYARINSLSCASTGNCSAGGQYTDGTPATEVFVVNEVNGIWGTATEVSRIAGLNKRRLAQFNSLSCASAGNCSAGGFYQDASFTDQAFLVTETNGTWGSATEVPGTATLDVGSSGAATSAVSCARAAVGDCVAGGFYSDSSDVGQAFIINETNGSWGTAEKVPGTAVLNAGYPGAASSAISCPSAGNCTVAGQYTSSTGATNVFVDSETTGKRAAR